MKKLVAVFTALFLFTSVSAFADDFDWSQCWCNYGAGIESGDMMLSVDGGIPWSIFDAFNSGGWTIPYVLADFQVACPIWKLPFTFGGYAGFGLSKNYVENHAFTHTYFITGGSATYHVRMPPKQLDLYTGIKTGLVFDFSDYYNSGRNIKFDFGYTIGASWYFTDMFGVNLELGYPMNRLGVVFQF